MQEAQGLAVAASQGAAGSAQGGDQGGDSIPAKRVRRGGSQAWPKQQYEADSVTLGPRMFSEMPDKLAEMAGHEEGEEEEQGDYMQDGQTPLQQVCLLLCCCCCSLWF